MTPGQVVAIVPDEVPRDVIRASKAVAEKHNARVVVYSGDIDNRGVGRLLQALKLEKGNRPNTFLVLTTNGGHADAAYRIARLLQTVSRRFYLFVPERCKSAGTLLALGANEIVMTPIISELGPLDVQLFQRNEIDRTRSGLVVHTALKGLADETLRAYENSMLEIKRRSGGLISFEVASQIAVSMTTGVMSSVYAQIKPDDLGLDLRELNVAIAYGLRLVRHGKNAKRGTVRHLVEDYPTHDFIIDASEAKGLFKAVSEPKDEVAELGGTLAASSLVDAAKDPCYVARLDTLEEKDGQTRGETTGGSGAELDVARKSTGPEDRQAGSREAGRGKRTTVPNTKRKSA